MRRLLTLFCGAMCGALALASMPVASSFAQEPGLVMPDIPKLSVTLEPAAAIEAGGYVQGQLLLKVQIASRFPFEALDLDLPEIPNAETIRILQPRTRAVRSYAGDGYVFETTLAIFPETSGTLEIPSIAVTGAVETDAGDELAFDDRSSAVRMEIAGIDPSYRDPWWLVSDLVVLSESWSKPIDTWRQGDIIRRKVTATVVGVTAAHIPELEHGPVRGVAIAEAGQSASTELAAKGMLATAKRSWDLKIETGDVIYIKPLRIVYWDPGERIEKVASLPGTRVEPLPPDEPALAAALLREAREDFDQRHTVLVSMILLMLAPLAATVVALLWVVWPTRADRALLRACAKEQGPADLYRAVSIWANASDLDLGDPSQAARPAFDAAPDTAAGPARTIQAPLQAAVFSTSTERIDRIHLAKKLIQVSRHARLQRLWRLRHRALDQLVGPSVRLQGHQP